MAYPFAQAPTLGELAAKLKPFGVGLRTLDGLHGPRGPVPIRYFERARNGHALRSEPLPEADDSRIGVDMLRRLCRQLQINPAELDLGLDLG